MARTAPAPNLIAIPGMNPGTWVMGGGAGGGGAGGGNGNGEDGAGGAAGDNDGQAGEGNGNNTGSCGEGGAGACTNCSSQTAAGDPIDVVTGEVFTGWKNDLWLPGFFNLAIDRKYSTKQRSRDVGCGFGWTHTLAWEIRIEPNKLILWTGTGRRAEIPVLAVGEQLGADGWVLARTEVGFLLRPGSELVHTFVIDPADPSVARLVLVEYRKRGTLELHYTAGKLTSVIDTAGRLIRFERDAAGRIGRLLVPEPGGPTTVFARYTYSDSGDLIQITDADGHVTRHSYDDAHRLTSTAHPTGLTYHFRYDERGRGVETWGDYPGKLDPALDPDVPAYLADGVTPARGVFHTRLQFFEDGTSEVTDSVHFHRYAGSSEHAGHIVKAVDSSGGTTTRTFDDEGHEIAHEDPLGAVWTWSYDRQGQVVSETDPEGHTVRVERDHEGRILQIIDPMGGAISYGRAPSGETEWLRDQRGGVVQHERDARGLLVALTDRSGAITRYRYDGMANLVEIVHADGGVTRSTYDYLGRERTSEDARGCITTSRRTTGGRLIALRDSLGRETRWEHDGLGHLVSDSYPGGGTNRITRGGDGWPTLLQSADGSEVKWLYNREGWLTRVINQRGETYRFFYDQEGHVTEEHTFDGRVRKVSYDARGRRIQMSDLDRGPTELTRNLLGQVVAETTASGEAWTFDYDARGEIVGASGPETKFSWARDPAGSIVSERFDVDGVVYTIDSQLDASGRQTAYRTSLGHQALMRRDGQGRVIEAWIDDQPPIRTERDLGSTPARRTLPQGGAIVDRRDAAGRLLERHVEPATGPRKLAAEATPDWVGDDGHWSLDTRYAYAANDELVRVESRTDGTTEYAYDLRRHLREKQVDGELREAFTVDAAGNYSPSLAGSPARTFGPGNRLLREGDTEYLYDSAGFLRERRRTRVAGGTTSGATTGGETSEITRYEWTDRGLLAHVDRPDGVRVAFSYDAYARRLRKTVATRTPSDDFVPSKTVHYVWDLTTLRHAVTYLPDGSRHIRTFVTDDRGDVAPLAQRDDNDKWVYYVGDPNGASVDLVDGAGETAGKLRRSAFGKTLDQSGVTTEARAPAQWEDEETGLIYNRYRYYDPETGRFLSPDPIGLDGGLNEYAYGPNPIGWFDAMGWAGHMLTVTSEIDGVPSGPYGNGYPSGWSDENDPHCPPDLRSEARCHSERKLIRDLENAAARNPGTPLGGRVTASGQLPPCPNCHRAMRRFARENGTTIEYQWTGADGRPQTITYVNSSGEPNFSGASARRLGEGYRMDTDRPHATYGHYFDDHAAARAAYTAESAGI